jgi:hypothetical protein
VRYCCQSRCLNRRVVVSLLWLTRAGHRKLGRTSGKVLKTTQHPVVPARRKSAVHSKAPLFVSSCKTRFIHAEPNKPDAVIATSPQLVTQRGD